MRERWGLLLGKFLPPHAGHAALIEFALAHVDRLSLQVCPGPDDPIPAALRCEWLRMAFPAADVVLNDDPNPQAPDDCPDAFYGIWRRSLLRHMPQPPDLVFAGEEYGRPLAAALGALWLPMDRSALPFEVSATQVRADVWKHWEMLLPAARPWFLRRVALLGPESTGKTVLSERLARHFHTAYAPEYGRTYTECRGMNLVADDFDRIARGHLALENALAQYARGVLIVDTDAIVTAAWARSMIGSVPAGVEEIIAGHRYDLYLLLPPDRPWVQDGTRVHDDPSVRDAFFEYCRARVGASGRESLELLGAWDAKFDRAAQAIASLRWSSR